MAITVMREYDTTVMSLPWRLTSAMPIGMVKSSSCGTSPLVSYSARLSIKITGSSSRMAARIRPLAS